ncbi:MAG TPA: cytochrome c3 family protein, partial [Anaeromyxobacteraceae bacterium]|nr:cytochrome c3 family protein [Anaeromyxobacteraceae bacterium]
MSRSGAVLVSALAVALAGVGRAPAAEPVPPPTQAHAGATRCAVCHTAAGWTPARFPHENTGFPLTGRHARASCKACHPVTLQEATGRECAACHRDPHGGISGRR